MGGVRNGKSAGTPEPAAARKDALRAGAPGVGPAEDARDTVDRHLRAATALLREGSASRAFGVLARASRTEPMTPRLAAALVRFALLAGTEAAAITLLEATPGPTADARLAARRQLARVLRRVGQLPRAIASLEALLEELPEDRRARREVEVLRARLRGAEAPGPTGSAGGPVASASGVLSKLPARRSGVQVPAVWEDSEERERTLVESPSGEPAPPTPSEPRERTAVAFPSVPAPPPQLPWADEAERGVPPGEARSKTETELPAVDLPAGPPRPASASRTEAEPPEVKAAREGPRPATRSSTEVELPAVASEAPRVEPRTRTEVELPALWEAPVSPPAEGVASTPSSASKAPGSSLPSREAAPPAGQEPPSVPWPEPHDAVAARPPVGVDARTQPPRGGARATDDDTGEITSESLPFLQGGGLPGTASSTDAEPTIPGEPPPAGPQAPPASPPPRSEGPHTAAAAQGRASGTRQEAGPAARAEEAEELARSQKLEAQLIARQAWRELAQLYLKRADRAKDVAVRAEALTRLAEVMENELQDPAGAARMYREIVELTGDRAALREQVRLLATRGDASLVRRALDDAIQRARSERARAGALLTRGERWLHMGEPGKARADFEAADALAPGMLPVLAGLLRCVSDAERPAAAERLRLALAAAPRRAPDRLEGLRLLAQTAEDSLGDPRTAQWAWTEVLAESPDSEPARERLMALARKLGDPKALGHLLRAQLAREARGPAARQARLELVSTLDALGEGEAALHELRQAVRYEPGHKEAWLLLVDRLIARGSMGEAAWALEHAATATEDERERERTWERLARLWTEVLRDSERAQVYARRAEVLRQAREEHEVPPPEPPRSATPRREPSGPRSPLVPAPPTLSLTPSGIAALDNEVTSTTDPGAPPAAMSEPASGNEGARAERDGAASRGRSSEASAAVPRHARKGSPEASGVAPAEPAPASSSQRGRRASDAAGASASPGGEGRGAGSPRAAASDAGGAAPAGTSPDPRPERAPAAGGMNVPSTAPGAGALPPRAERAPASGGMNAPSTLAGAGAVSPRAERAPASGGMNVPSTPAGAGPAGAGASSPRAERASAASSAVSPPAASSSRASAPGGAAPASKSPAAPRGATPRGEKSAAPPRSPPAVSDGEPSVAATRALGSSARQGRSGAGDVEGAPRGKAADPIAEEEMDLGSAPVPETRLIAWEAPPGRMDPVRRVVRARPEGTASPPAPGRPAAARPPAPPDTREPPARMGAGAAEPREPAARLGPGPGAAEPREPLARVGPGATETREAPVTSAPSSDIEPDALRHIRERPLDAKPYRELAGYFDGRGDTDRAALMREIADALEGRETAAPRLQRPPLTSDERAGLRHPGLRTPSGELLACTGIALCRLFPAQGRAAGTSEPLRASAGPGAPAVLDALHTSARLLGVHLPELVLAEDEGPPFTAVHAGTPRLLVGRLAVRQPLPAAELRFHAGRALLSLSPDLLALRALKGGQLLRALALLTTLLKDPRASGPEARVVRESLSPRALERAVALVEPGTRDFDASALVDAARDSANRAGLVACGSLGPAVAVLRARRNADAELVELLRFAASERYLELRAPR